MLKIQVVSRDLYKYASFELTCASCLWEKISNLIEIIENKKQEPKSLPPYNSLTCLTEAREIEAHETKSNNWLE